mgnify:CR=1 FL=1|tara:strand:- start:7482 stop:9671 length:2190 start_codon:yes stop_codon:yes gene_type:complete
MGKDDNKWDDNFKTLEGIDEDITNNDENSEEIIENPDADLENTNDEEEHDMSNVQAFGNSAPKSTTPLLDHIGRDFTKRAEDGKIDPIIGREKEIDQIIWVLSRKNKNNPVIIGEAGVGKTAIVEGIARMIVGDDCPDSLKDKKIIYVDMGSIMAGTSKQGDLENRIKQMLHELEENQDVILFIDEIHLIVNENLPIDVSNMFKPALARGEMRCIGATTYDEYRESIEKDGALARRFQKVDVEPTNVKDTIAILKHIKSTYEDYHKVSYSDNAIVACVKLSDRYITDRFFPDKAIDLLDEVGARVRISRKKNVPPEVVAVEVELHKVRQEKQTLMDAEKYQEASATRPRELELLDELEKLGEKYTDEEISEVSQEDVEKVISIKTGIPVTRLTKDQGARLLNLEKDLSVDIVGQEEAVSKVSKCIRRSRSGIKDPNRPSGVFLFLGSTGVGKTHTVKVLAKHLYDTEKDVVRIDMSEYGAPHNVSRLIGAPPGYVGYGEGGQLTEKVRRKPNSIILLDEIEKAHPKVLDVLLQVFDDGQLTDGNGKTVDFKNTIIVMTSNIGTSSIDNLMEPVGFGTSKSTSTTAHETRVKNVIEKELKEKLRPEFLNRIDDIVIFNSLNEEAIYRIISSEVGKLAKRLEEMGYTLTITDNVKDLLLEQGYDEKMGARPLKRAIQKYLEDPISDGVIRKDFEEGDDIEMDYDKTTKKISINGNYVSEKLVTEFKEFVKS